MGRGRARLQASRPVNVGAEFACRVSDCRGLSLQGSDFPGRTRSPRATSLAADPTPTSLCSEPRSCSKQICKKERKRETEEASRKAGREEEREGREAGGKEREGKKGGRDCVLELFCRAHSSSMEQAS